MSATTGPEIADAARCRYWPNRVTAKCSDEHELQQLDVEIESRSHPFARRRSLRSKTTTITSSGSTT